MNTDSVNAREVFGDFPLKNLLEKVLYFKNSEIARTRNQINFSFVCYSTKGIFHSIVPSTLPLENPNNFTNSSSYIGFTSSAQSTNKIKTIFIRNLTKRQKYIVPT